MWSLPDINRLNTEAASKAFQAQIAKQLKGRARLDCIICDKPSTRTSRQFYFDIFSEDPKGVIGLCKEHEECFGGCPEGYFWCERCNRLFAENYTWEMYSSESEDGSIVCLNCKAKEYVDNPDNWIQLPEGIDELSFERVRQAGHVIAVKGPVPKGIKAYGDGVTLDNSTGGRVTGFSSSESSPDGGVEELKEQLYNAYRDGHTEALLILDGAYQFAVSIGVYVRED